MNSVPNSAGAQLAGNGSIVLTTGGDGFDYASSAASTFGGNISGPNVGGFEVDSDSLTLGGSNTYSGPTTLTGGLLTAAAPGAFSLNSAVTVTMLSDWIVCGQALASSVPPERRPAQSLDRQPPDEQRHGRFMSYTSHLGSFTLATSFAGYTLTANATSST